jgi:predicted glycosyltransferase
MNILVQLSHPAHFHLYKNAIKNWQNNGNQVFILIKTKDILEDLLKEANLPYYNILPDEKRKSKFDIFKQMIIKDFRIARFCIKHKIDLLTGSTPEVAQVAWILRRFSVNTGEDDMAVVPAWAKAAGPFVQTLLTPEVCDNGKLNAKSIKYNSYHELAYLHPNHFTPDKSAVEKYFSPEKPYFIIRFAKLNAHHDTGIQGINTEIAQKIINILKSHGDIYITSERELEPQFEQFRIKINPLDMHDVMAFAQIYIGDSQTMAAEAGVLGVPFVRFNDFVGRIGYLDELENYYNLGFGIKTKNVEKLYSVINELVTMENCKEIFQNRKQKMLSEKIDYAKFLTWFIENYPKSKQIMQENSDYQYNI